MKADYLDIDEEALTPGWIPEGWEKGEPFELRKWIYEFTISANGVTHTFDNALMSDFFAWLEWWNDE